MTKGLHDRFPDKNIVSSFKIFDPKLLPAGNILTYGNGDIKVLYDHYRPLLKCSLNRLKSEWGQFKYTLKEATYQGASAEQVHINYYSWQR